VAKGSLEELRLDYEDYLRQRGLPQWKPNHPALMRFKARRYLTLDEFRAWVAEEMKRAGDTDETQTATDTQRQPHARNTDGVGVCQCPSVWVANGALSLLNLCCYLLGRQVQAQADAFEREGGFTERLYRVRSERRRE